MPDDLVLPLPVGARALVVAELRLTPRPTPAARAAANEVATAVRAWSGPGAVVVAGGLLACGPSAVEAEAALAAHPELSEALAGFAAGAGRHVVVLPGTRDGWLGQHAAGALAVSALLGATVAPSVTLEMATVGGARRVLVGPGGPPWPGDGSCSLEADGGARQRMAEVVPGLWRGATSGWLSGAGQLDDQEALSRFVMSRLLYRQLARRAWLLALPVVVAVLARLPVAIFRPAHPVAGVLLRVAVGAVALELVVVLGLMALFVRQIWVALAGHPGAPSDLNEAGRARARQLAGEGWAGVVLGATARPELSSAGPGFYANAGACSEVVSEYPSRLAFLGLPSAFLAARRVGWLELEAGNELHARLLLAQELVPGPNPLELHLARVPGLAASPAVVASWPHGQPWPLTPSGAPPHRRSRRLAALVVAAAGFVSVLSALAAPVAQRLDTIRQYLPLAVPKAAGALTALGGLGLVMLARGIRRGQRRAYLVCQAVLVTVALGHLVKGGNLPTTAIDAAVAAFLWLRRGSFRAASDRPPLRRGLARLAAAAGLAVLAGGLTLEGTSWITTRLHHRHLGRTSWGQAFLATVERMVGVRNVPLPDRLDDFFTFAMSAIAGGLLVAAAWMVFRPVVAHRPRGGASGTFERAREVVGRYGAGTLDYFSLRSDKQFYFWGDTVVAYAVYSGVCLVSPDPVGPPAQRELAWRNFREHVDANGWAVAVLGASEEWLPIYRSAGMHDLYVGDEAVVRVGEFSLGGGKFKGLRQAVKRVARHGYTISFHDPARVSPDLAAQMHDVMTKSRRGGVERGFSMTLGRIFDPEDRGLLLAVVHGPPAEGAAGPGPVVAFCQYVPAPGIEGFSLDLMRRDNGDHPNGLIDFAIVETVRHLAERGYKGLGLNFAAMRAVVAGEAGDSLSQRVQGWLLRRMSGTMQIESLWRFNAKFDPYWQPRYAVFDSPEHALPAALAVARAESFWEIPVIGRFLVPSSQRQMEAAGTVGDG